MSDYKQHGRRHGPQGSDPIDGIGGIQFDTDNEGGWLFVDTRSTIAGVDPNYDGYGMALVDGEAAGIVIDSDRGVSINTVQNGGLTVGQPGSAQSIALNGEVTLDGSFDAGGARITNGADGVDPTDFATVEQLASASVTSLDALAGAITLVAGANITITDDSPSPGDITIAAAGGSGGGSQVDYREITSDVTVSGSSGSPTSVIDGNLVTFDGSTRVKVEFSTPQLVAGDQATIVDLYDGVTLIGRICQGYPSIAYPAVGAVFLTPSAGSHTYHIKAWKNGGSDAIVSAGGIYVPAWYRITVA